MKEKVSLTLSNSILKEVDNIIDGSMILNRSHAIEVLIKRALSQERINQALILVGGKGTRLKPFTYEIPKPMIPINNKPLLEHIILRLKKAGVNNIFLSVGYKAEKIISHFGDGSKFDVKIEYIIENEPLGTAGPLLLAKNSLDENFLMLNGDIVSDIDYADLLKFHKRNGNMTMSLVEVEDPTKFGVAELKGEKIIGFVEKPAKEKAPSKLVNAGVYVLSKDIFNRIDNGFQMIEDIFPNLAKEGKLNGYHHPGYWIDIGTLKAYEKVQEDLQAGKLGWLA